jgi:hypothetical protein
MDIVSKNDLTDLAKYANKVARSKNNSEMEKRLP